MRKGMPLVASSPNLSPLFLIGGRGVQRWGGVNKQLTACIASTPVDGLPLLIHFAPVAVEEVRETVL